MYKNKNKNISICFFILLKNVNLQRLLASKTHDSYSCSYFFMHILRALHKGCGIESGAKYSLVYINRKRWWKTSVRIYHKNIGKLAIRTQNIASEAKVYSKGAGILFNRKFEENL